MSPLERQMVNVDPGLPDDPKYRRLKKRLADTSALEVLIRLWGHCQQANRGHCWRGADAEYVEDVCRWEGPPGKLFNLLLELLWIEQDGDTIRIHDWDQYNAGLISNWRNGKKSKGRPKNKPPPQAMPNPPETHGLSTCNPPETHGGSNAKPMNEGMNEGMKSTPARNDFSEAVLPTPEDIVAFGAGGAAIPPDYCRAYWEKKQVRPKTWFDRGDLIDWRRELVFRWTQDRGTWRPPLRADGANNLNSLRAALQVERDSKKRLRLEDEIERLEGAGV